MLAAVVGAAEAPIKGATYKGKVTSGDTNTPVKVRLKVSSSGKRLNFVLVCFGEDVITVKGVKITDGKFTASDPPYFGASGRFVTRRKAKGSISGNACFLNGTVPWRARKV